MNAENPPIQPIQTDPPFPIEYDQIEPAPSRPDVTPIQLTAIIGVLVQVSRAFGVWDASAEQTDALNAATALLGALVFGDAGLRGLRNLAQR